MTRCDKYALLESEVTQILADLAQLTTTQLELFRFHKHTQVMRVDKELELMVGKKERALGALRQHVADHECQPGSESLKEPTAPSNLEPGSYEHRHSLNEKSKA